MSDSTSCERDGPRFTHPRIEGLGIDPAEAFAELKRRAALDPGFRLFTVLQWLPETRTLRRVASNHPVEYPVGAEKSVEVLGSWLDIVIRDRRTFLGAHDDDVAAVFADIELIRLLGCGSVVNASIVSDGSVVGVLAILDADGAYDLESVAAVERHVAALADELAAAFRRLDASAPHSSTTAPKEAI